MALRPKVRHHRGGLPRRQVTPPTPPYKPQNYDFYYGKQTIQEKEEEDYDYADDYTVVLAPRKKFRYPKKYRDYPEFLHHDTERGYNPARFAPEETHHHNYIHYVTPQKTIRHDLDPSAYLHEPKYVPNMEISGLRPPRLLPSSGQEGARVAMFADMEPSKHFHTYHHHPPIMSNKNIPSMRYDELRCPHCAAHAQPAQNQVVSYPWTVQTNKPQRTPLSDYNRSIASTRTMISKARSLPAFPTQALSKTSNKTIEAPSTFIQTKQDVKPLTLHNRRSQGTIQGSVASNIGRMEIVSNPGSLREKVEPTWSEPIFTTRTRPMDVVEEGPIIRPVYARSRISHNGYRDDVLPIDSISNVAYDPKDRAHVNESRFIRRHRPRVETATEADLDYPRKHFFNNMEQTGFTPPPGRRATSPDGDTHVTRVLQGDYMDRQSGNRFNYEVNYKNRNVEARKTRRR